MIDRFLYFRSEIKELLRLASQRAEGDKFNLDAFEILNSIFLGLEAFKSDDLKAENPYPAFGLVEATKKLLEYYPIRSGDIAPIKNLCLATVLDPRYNLGVFKSLDFPQPAVDEIKSYFYDVFNRSAEEFEVDLSTYSKYGSREIGSSHANASDQSNHVQEEIDTDFFPESDIDAEDLHEVDAYPKRNRTRQCLNIMMYHRDRREIAPIIYRIARDYLAIPAMSAPSEALFSRVNDIVTKKRNELSKHDHNVGDLEV